MTTLTSTGTFTVGDAATVTESATVTVLPAAGAYAGTGRLVHPSLGTYDYERPPDEWMNLDGDAIIAPIWGSTKTLLGASNTLFVGNLRDVVVEERWTQNVSCSLAHVRQLLAMWMNAPDPSVAYVQWRPTYWSENAFNVVLLELTVGGKAVTLTSLAHQGWVRGPVVLKMRIASRV